jgi:hypothetical protein
MPATGATEHCRTRTDLDSHVCHNPRRALAAIRRPMSARVRGRTLEMSRRHRERGHGRPHRPDAAHGGPPRHAPVPPLQGHVPPLQAQAPPLPGTVAPVDGQPAPPPSVAELPPLPRPTTPAGLAAGGSPPGMPDAGLAGSPPASPLESATSTGVLVPGVAWTPEQAGPNGRPNGGSCTPAQLRRFIKSRAWVPMHELRRRFAINGSEDEMTLVEVGGSGVFIGLPDREGHILGDLLRGGEVGFELSQDPASPVVVGVYPMRPVPRP